MNQPFYAAANKVLTMYAFRQERASAKAPAHSPAEVNWACEILEGIALAAAYAGSDECFALQKAAANWASTNCMPPMFILEG